MKEIPSIKEFLEGKGFHSDDGFYNNVMEDEIKELIELHVTAALNSAAYSDDFTSGFEELIKNSILNAYPLSNIK
jgi:hypothetical protein